MPFLPDALPADERALLARAGAWPHHRSWRDLDVPTLAELARAQGGDFATAVVYDRLHRSEHGPWLDSLSDEPLPPAPDLTVVVAPGAFYRERPDTGAGGERVLEHAAAAGCRVARLPLGSFADLRDNARRLCDELARLGGNVVLVSLSKATAEVKLALAEPSLAPALARLRAWVNLSGLPFGTPLVSWLLSRPLRRQGARLLLWWHGYSYRTLQQMRWGPGAPLDAPFPAPPGVLLYHVVGLPLARHLSGPLAVRGTQRTAAWGPSDGGPFLLGDLPRLPGRLCPVWGCDHYLRPAWDIGRLIRALLRDIVGALAAPTTGRSCHEDPAPAARR
jgi:hypothetical protein